METNTITTDMDLTEWTAAIMGGYTEYELERAFAGVQDLRNWKNPISVTVSASVTLVTRDQIRCAIDYYVGGGAVFTDLPDGAYKVEAPGYYKTINAF